MVRILQVISYMGRGGAETMIMNYYKNIDRSKIQFDFVVFRKERSAYDNEIENLGGLIFRLPRFNGRNIIYFIKEWNNFLSNHPEYKIIHIHFYSIAGLLLPSAKKHDIPVRIVHSHNTSPKYGFLNNFFSVVLNKVANKYLTDRMACSADAGKSFFGEKDFIVVNNAIDTKKFIYNPRIRLLIRTELGLNNKFVIGHIGRFNIQKNHSFLIEVFAEIAKYNDKAVLMLVGDGKPLRNEMEDKVKRLNLTDRVIFTGVRADIPELLQAMDVFVFPSLWEGLGIVAVEAQAAGLKTIVSNAIPKEAFVTSLCESISLKDSIKVWADKILQYNNHYERKNTFQQICNAEYDIVKSTRWLENFYTIQ